MPVTGLDCLLIHPRSVYYSETERNAPYLYSGLLSIANVIAAAGYKVTVLDAVTETDFAATLKALLKTNSGTLKLAGLTAMTSQTANAVELARIVRSESPAVKTVWGGIHPTLFPEGILKTGLADYVCTGEGEYAALELLQSIEAGTTDKPVAGLWTLRNGMPAFGGERPPHEMDKLPYLEYSFVDYGKYKTKFVPLGTDMAELVTAGPIITGMGCPYRCTFCINSNKRAYLGRYRMKSARRIVEEMEYLSGRYGVDYFEISDENFFVSKPRVLRVLDLLEKSPIKVRWNTNIRADYLNDTFITQDILRRLKACGCVRLGLGAESGSQRVLDKLKKDIKVEDIVRSSRMLGEAGIVATFSFMMGIPGETVEDVRLTRRLITQIRRENPNVTIIGPQIFRPYPGGELYQECVEKYGYVSPATIEDWTRCFDMATGFEDLEHFTWITDPALMRKMAYYSDFANNIPEMVKGSALKKLLLKLFVRLARLRVEHFWYGFAADMCFMQTYKKLKLPQGGMGEGGAPATRPRANSS